MTCKAKNDGNGWMHCRECDYTAHEFFGTCQRKHPPLWLFIALAILGAVIVTRPSFVLHVFDWITAQRLW